MRLADEVHKVINNKQFTLSVMNDLEKRSTSYGTNVYSTRWEH